MIKQFPEIEEFFKQNQFTDTDLNQLRLQIEENYNTSSLRKAAESSINLKLAFYILKKEANPNYNPADDYKANIPQKLSSHKTIAEHFLELTLNKPLIKVSIIIGISLEKLCEILQIDKNTVDRKTKFTEEHWKLCEQSFVKRLEIIKKKTKSYDKQGIKKSSTKLSESNSVFDKAKKYGGVGKIIYIRQK